MRSCNKADCKNVALNLQWSIQQQTLSKLHTDLGLGLSTFQSMKNVQEFFVYRKEQTISFHYQYKLP